jgi:hypothetical protein
MHSSRNGDPFISVNKMMRNFGNAMRNCFVASSPVICGMHRSVSTRSGLRLLTRSNMLRPSLAVPTTSKRSSKWRYSHTALSAVLESSATTTRIFRPLLSNPTSAGHSVLSSRGTV